MERANDAKPRSVRVRQSDWESLQRYSAASGRPVGVVAERLIRWFADQPLEVREQVMMIGVDLDADDDPK